MVDRPTEWLPDVALAFQMEHVPWTLISGLNHPQAKHRGFYSPIKYFAELLFEALHVDVLCASRLGFLELRVGEAANYMPCNILWEDEGVPNEWFAERGLFVPPYDCRVEGGFLEVWFAGVSIDQVVRMDLFSPPSDLR